MSPWDSCAPWTQTWQTEGQNLTPSTCGLALALRHPHGPCIHWHGDLATTTIRVTPAPGPPGFYGQKPWDPASLTSRLALALDRASTICAWGLALEITLDPSYSCPWIQPHPPMGPAVKSGFRSYSPAEPHQLWNLQPTTLRPSLIHQQAGIRPRVSWASSNGQPLHKPRANAILGYSKGEKLKLVSLRSGLTRMSIVAISI